MLSKKRPANTSTPLLQQNPQHSRGNWGATLKLIVISGSGLFADGWNLQTTIFVVAILSYKYPHRMLLHKEVLIDCVTLIGVFIGELVFGCIGDILGRKWSAVVTPILSIAGMVAAGCVHDQGYLTIPLCASLCFFVAGLGIGGEIPLTAAMSKEMGHDLCFSRLALLEINCLLFTLGSMLHSVFSLILLSANVSFNAAWRTVAILGAIPSVVAICFRIFYAENEATPHPRGKRVSSYYDSSIPIMSKPFLLLVAVSMTWSAQGFASFGLNGFTHGITNALMSAEGDTLRVIVKKGVVMDMVLASLQLAGNLVGAYCVQRGFSLKRIQWVGLVLMVGCIWLCGFSARTWLCVTGYGLTALMDGIVSVTLYIVPTVCFPRPIRATAVGVASGVGKIGAVLGTALLPLMFRYTGVSTTVILYGAAVCLGVGSTMLIPNTVLQDCKEFM